ncbi:putative disease resistance protein RGA4 isoform X2 [Carex littledalei]|uniref:Putative disease resistance protein RGA4 isoform X2 n=1 Tax=Carex littledalei TaxID=544730 RepID=A0A833RGM0_9POAL|nr:putative disease resistance protein RGA4 isoform X2 [Carex littledalei]
MASMLISGLIPLLQQSGSMLKMEKERHKLLDFFTDTLPKLADAELRAEAEPDVRTWLDDLNAAAYEADDIVDDFRYAKLQAEAEADGCRNQNGDRVRAGLFLLSCFKSSSNNRSGALQGIENRISSIVNKIDDLDERMRAFNFRPGQEINITSLERPQQLNFSSLTEIVGRDNEIREIIKNLPKGLFQMFLWGLKPKVLISIVGPQGIGKTAFARFVCNNDVIKSRWVVWVDVGSEFNIGKITKSIIDQVIGKDCCISEGDTDLLVLRLSQELCYGRYLVVLDDVQTVCKELILKFRKLIIRYKAPVILLVTSSFQEVAQMFGAGRNYNYVLEPLMDNDGWNLFCKKAFWDDANETCPEILKEMGKKIVVTCGGSPLALNMMGGLMRFKKQPEEWRRVINQLENYTVDGVPTVEKIIKVCYDNLCSQVKQCFAFCSLFPEGYYMDKEVLIKLWMANGLLLPSDGSRSMPPEENGSIVFNELASRHFFEDVKLIHGNYSYENKHGYHSSRVTCKLLDLIRKQAVIAAREFALQNPYLLSISGDSQVDIPILLENNPAVRTLLSPGDPFIRNVNCSTVPRANSLRGLHLHSALFQRDLLVLKYMRHLRYLDLSGSRIKILPESTSLLYFLQTLNLSKCLLLYQLPENMKYMRSLRHLYIHKCPKLKKMPANFRQLNDLHTLTTYIVGEENTGTGIDQIKGLHLGGLLELYNLHKVKTVTIAKEADLVSKTNLDRLTLNWGTESLVMSKNNNDLGVLEALQPHTQLKVLKVQQYGGREFATWLAHPVEMGFINFVELHLIGCSQCKTLPALWKLPSLRVLCLKHMPSLTCISRTDKKDSSEQFFPSLKRLVLVGLKKLERWHEEVIHTIIGGGETKEEETTFEEVTIFTVLDQLEITSCPNLKTMPRVPRLKHITASIENYRLLRSVTNAITRAKSLVEEANIAKASSSDNEPFPALEEEVEDQGEFNLRILRMDSTNSFFMPSLPHSLLGVSGLWRSLEGLEYLEIINCNTLVSWPLEFIHMELLIRLSIRMCPNLTGKLPAQEENNIWIPSLRKLEFYGCSSLKQFPACGGELDVLELDECPQVESISGIQRVDMLYLSCISWTSLPSWLPEIKELGTLWVSECPMVKELPGGEWLSSLKKLKISECPDLEKFCKEGPYSSIISQIGKKDDVEDESNEEEDEEDNKSVDEEDESNEEDDEEDESDDEEDENNELDQKASDKANQYYSLLDGASSYSLSRVSTGSFFSKKLEEQEVSASLGKLYYGRREPRKRPSR